MDLKLRGKRALVTGSSRGIGRAIALSLADFKVDVAINYLRNRTRAEETAHEIEERGVRSLVLKGNVAKPDHVERLFSLIDESWGGSGCRRVERRLRRVAAGARADPAPFRLVHAH